MASTVRRGDIVFVPAQGAYGKARWAVVIQSDALDGGDIIAITPNESLTYSWSAHGLESVVTWTCTPIDTETLLRLEQTGFCAGQQSFLEGAKSVW